jgi:DNA repair ATPase RecN
MAKNKQEAPAEVGEKLEALEAAKNGPTWEQKFVQLKDVSDKKIQQFISENNLLSDRLRDLRKEFKSKTEMFHEMFNKTTADLIEARETVDKYLEKCNTQGDEIDLLEARIAEFECAGQVPEEGEVPDEEGGEEGSA